MMRSLWTAASGMITQQHNVDNIANNLANVNTVGFKKERMEFKTLLYETLRRADLDPTNQSGSPVSLQIGHGVRPVAVSRMFTQGNMQRTDNPQDFMIEGEGFFAIRRSSDGMGDIKYTKDGSFKLSWSQDGLMLVTSEGFAVLGVDDEPIIFQSDFQMEQLIVDDGGRFFYMPTDGGEAVDLDMRIKLVQFSNPQGLEAIGSNLFGVSVASGQPLSEADGETSTLSRLMQGMVEMSNVNVAEEMVDLIVAQRAYDLNSKAITTSDEMLQTANNLKR